MLNGNGWAWLLVFLWEAKWFMLALILPSLLIGLGTGWFIWG
ncbi:hypothetical protein MHI49_28540 [Bacillus sp. FSL M7-0884]